MPDAVTLARLARESLSRGLSSLQGDPNVPRPLLDLAPAIAQTMGSLHQIERSGGAPVDVNVEALLPSLQNLLAKLQSHPADHPAVSSTLEAVAGALAQVHALVRLGKPAPEPPRLAPQQITVRTKPVSTAMTTAGANAPTQLAVAQPQVAPPAPAGPRPAPPPPRQGPAPASPQAKTQEAGSSVPKTGAADGPPVTAELGAHSTSNFYKGLSGNDIIDHGGLFVSTYKLLKIGQSLRLKVSLPGGYEFEANAIVRWRREPSDAGNDAPPGFGAQFTEITAEARQLVYRYVRNREPLFHDDM